MDKITIIKEFLEERIVDVKNEIVKHVIDSYDSMEKYEEEILDGFNIEIENLKKYLQDIEKI